MDNIYIQRSACTLMYMICQIVIKVISKIYIPTNELVG